MMTQEGEKVLCIETGKICYTEREAGIVMNKARKHSYEGHMKTHKEHYANSKEIPRRKYWCKACGFYHVTHMSRSMILIPTDMLGKRSLTKSRTRERCECRKIVVYCYDRIAIRFTDNY
ncbi:MAG: hypothetical protein KBT02_12955, partial [Treponema sp.]|nr:hypothetical protein [Candidatus Treponema caballi]